MTTLSDNSLMLIRSWKGFELFDGSDFNYKSKNEEIFTNHENTVLMEATEKGALDVVNELILAGADVNAVNQGTGQTPLLFIKENTCNAVKITNALVKAGANINFIQKLYDDWINAPLISACMYGRLELVKELINLGADVNLSSAAGRSAICLIDSSSEDYFFILKELMTAGAFIDAGNGEALKTAIRNGNEEAISFLLKAGADADLQDDDGKTALMCVLAGDAGVFSAEKAMELYNQVIGVIKNINITDKNKRSALFYALNSHMGDERSALFYALNSHIGDKDAKTFLIDKIIFRDDLNANVIDEDGNNALNYFLSSIELINDCGQKKMSDEDKGIISDLLVAGCDAELRNKQGISPKIMAKRLECEDLIGLFQMKREIVNLENRQGQSPLLIASAQGYTAKIQWLLKKGADPDKKNRCQRRTINLSSDMRFPIPMGEEEIKPKLITGLMVSKNIETVRLLIKAGADVNAKTVDGNTALMFFSTDAWVEGVNEVLSARANPDLTNKWQETALLLAVRNAKLREPRFAYRELGVAFKFKFFVVSLLKWLWRSMSKGQQSLATKDELEVVRILNGCTRNKLIPYIVAPIMRSIFSSEWMRLDGM